MELGKPYSQITFYLCIESNFKKTFDNNCETPSFAACKNQAKLTFSILENGSVNDETLDNYFNDFNLDYLNPTDSNNQEFTLNNEIPFFLSRTTVLVNDQENQAQLMGNQIPDNTNQLTLQNTMMNQLVIQIPNHEEERNRIEN